MEGKHVAGPNEQDGVHQQEKSKCQGIARVLWAWNWEARKRKRSNGSAGKAGWGVEAIEDVMKSRPRDPSTLCPVLPIASAQVMGLRRKSHRLTTNGLKT